jgi:hypothetical protein
MKWAEPTWLFFHSFAQKVKEDFYRRYHAECGKMFSGICNELPCPVCRDHATVYFAKNFKNINSKEKLIEFFFNFHNYVNLRIRKEKADRSILEKYKLTVFPKIIKYFLDNFKANSIVSRDFSNQLSRRNLIKNVRNWFKKNYRGFQY